MTTEVAPSSAPAEEGATSGPDRSAAMASLWRRVRPHRAVLVAAMLLGLAGAAADLVQPLAAKWVIDALGRDGGLLGPVALLAGLVVIGAVLAGVHYWVLERTAEGIALTARLGLAERLLRLRVPELDRRPTGDLLSRVGSDTTLLRAAATSGLEGGVTGALSLVASLILMGLLDWRLLVTTLGVLVVILAGVVVILPRVGRATTGAQEAIGTMVSRVEGALASIRTVKASGAEDVELRAIGEAARDAHGFGLRVARLTAAASVLSGVALQVAFLSVLGVGGALVADGSLDIGTLVAFLLYLFYLASPIAQLTIAGTQLQAGLAAIRRIDEVAELPAEPSNGAADPTGAEVPAVGGDLVLRGVRFRYAPDGPAVLDGLDLTIPSRGQTAIVGPSGVGKTTLFALVERFYSPDAGRILLGGRDISELGLADLRARIGYVEQAAPVLPATLRDNLTYAAPGASDEEIHAVVATTRLAELVSRLPERLDTRIGDGGVPLSGGERQRVAIARALLRRPAVLLLDEPTSQLDAANEAAIQETLREAARERAVVVIAHRLSTVAAADRIAVLDAGRVRAIGTHDELLVTDDVYRDLAARQLMDAWIRDGATRGAA